MSITFRDVCVAVGMTVVFVLVATMLFKLSGG